MASQAVEETEMTLGDRMWLKDQFDKYAVENGYLNKKQLGRLLRENHVEDTLDAFMKAHEYMSKYDESDDGKMDFDEYLQCAGIEILKAKAVKEDWKTETLRRVFKAADKDGSGKLSVSEIMELTYPTVFDLQAEAESNTELSFNDSLVYLNEAALHFQDSVWSQIVGVGKMFNKTPDDYLDKDEVKRAIPFLEDLVRVFKRVAKVNEGDDNKPSKTDRNAPIPKDGVLYPTDAVDLFTYYHFHRLEKESK